MKCTPRLAARLATGLCLFAAFTISAGAQNLNDSLGGYTLDKLAKAFAIETKFKATHGEAGYQQHFQQYLEEQMDSSVSGFRGAYQLWYDAWSKDSSGKLEARFHTLHGGYWQDVLSADSADQSKTQVAGIALEDYARIAVALSQNPNVKDDADVLRVLKQSGVPSLARWKEINDGWVAKMQQDTDVVLQYGKLYQQYAGAGFAEATERAIAGHLAGRFQETDSEPSETPVQREHPALEYSRELTANQADTRWYAANRMLFHCGRYRRFGDPDGVGLAARCSAAALERDVLPIVSELLSEFGDSDVGDASGILDLVKEVKLHKALGRAAVADSLARAERRYQALRAEFDPIQFKDVPQKPLLRARLDQFEAAIAEFRRELSDW